MFVACARLGVSNVPVPRNSVSNSVARCHGHAEDSGTRVSCFAPISRQSISGASLGAHSRPCRRISATHASKRRPKPQLLATSAAAGNSKSSDKNLGPAATKGEQLDPGDPAKRNLLTAASATRRLGWASFWTQLTLSVVSCILFVFSVAFAPTAGGPAASLYLTLFGIIAGLVSTFWAFGYVRLSRKLRSYMEAGPGADVPRIRKVDVLATLQRGSWINVVGLGATIVGLQATVGLLVAKTLTNATANPFLSGGSGSYNPVLALDVFLIQASTNTLLAHFASLVFSLILSRIVSRGAGQQGGQVVPAT